ncbi:hypothetical protein [Virgibacillus oceani]|uniref:Uncharacterized protein n=1 Tax=Virgibacillus oceani TaxID=1479511 RepID=A0A917HEK7_9BACI|nr:hypothetical protein [Virgibacillus oceani]GGG76604.1 hypothetical protein GCM10011398_21990 [Virgibacillus oceani]
MKERFETIDQLKNKYPVDGLCSILEVSVQSFNLYRKSIIQPEDFIEEKAGIYGVYRIASELRKEYGIG